MKKLFLVLFLCPSIIGCSNKKNIEKYNVYSSILDNDLNALSLKNKNIIVKLDDSILAFKDDLSELIFNVKNYDSFFTDYFKYDPGFKDFILNIKTVESKVQPMEVDKIKTHHNFQIVYKNDSATTNKPAVFFQFSDVVFNEAFDKAVLYVGGSSSGWWYFLRYRNNEWIIDDKLQSWIS